MIKLIGYVAALFITAWVAPYILYTHDENWWGVYPTLITAVSTGLFCMIRAAMLIVDGEV